LAQSEPTRLLHPSNAAIPIQFFVPRVSRLIMILALSIRIENCPT
jgi:hypothetical protein